MHTDTFSGSFPDSVHTYCTLPARLPDAWSRPALHPPNLLGKQREQCVLFRTSGETRGLRRPHARRPAQSQLGQVHTRPAPGTAQRRGYKALFTLNDYSRDVEGERQEPGLPLALGSEPLHLGLPIGIGGDAALNLILRPSNITAYTRNTLSVLTAQSTL